MRDSQLKLTDKTILLTGNLSQVGQSTAMTLTEMGANVIFLVDSEMINGAERVASNITDSREINDALGRAAALSIDINSKDYQEVLSRSAELFGGFDALVDLRLLDKDSPINLATSEEDFSQVIQEETDVISKLAEQTLPFLQGRNRGRIIFSYFNALKLQWPSETLTSEMEKLIQQYAGPSQKHRITINSLGVGITDEYLLAKYPKSGSLKNALEEIQSETPTAAMVQASQVANVIAFLSSPMSSAITAQNINVNHGIDL